MKILLANGCSHTSGAEIEYKNQVECHHKAWPKFIADKLGCGYVNLAKAGSGNQRIIRTTQSWIIDNVIINKNYRPEDITLFIMWSGLDRKEVYFRDTNVLDDINPLCKPEYIRTNMVKEINTLKDVIVYFHDILFSNYEFLMMFINFNSFLENNKIKVYYANGINEVMKPSDMDNTHRLYHDYTNLMNYINSKQINYMNINEQNDVFFHHMNNYSKIPMPKHVEFAHWGEDGQIYWANKVYDYFFNKKLI